MNQNLYHYKAELVRVVDGDTIWCNLDRGFGDHSRKNIRVARINTPEIRGVEKKEGLLAKRFVEDKLADCLSIVIQSTKVDSFGRAIAEVWLEESENTWVNLNDLLVEKEHAVYKDY